MGEVQLPANWMVCTDGLGEGALICGGRDHLQIMFMFCADAMREAVFLGHSGWLSASGSADW